MIMEELYVMLVKLVANIIITGAGIPTNMPEFTKDYPDVALVPIVSSARALKLICKKWQRYNKIPDAVIVEGPLSGGHQGFKYEDCFKEEFQLENIVPPVIEEAKMGRYSSNCCWWNLG